MIKAILIVLGAFTFWVFCRNFFWPWLSNQIFLWRYARHLRVLKKKLDGSTNPHVKEIANMVEELANKIDEQRRNNKL